MLETALRSIADRVEDAVSGLGASLSSAERHLTAGTDYVAEHALIGASATYTNATVSVSASKAEGASHTESVNANVPQVGASVDVGVKGETPSGTQTGSVDLGVNDHLGVSITGYRDTGRLSPKSFHPNGVVVHVGAGTPTSPIGGTVDLKPAP